MYDIKETVVLGVRGGTLCTTTNPKKKKAAIRIRFAGCLQIKRVKAANNLAKYKPHKNAEKKEDFREQSDNFKKNLSALGKAIKEKDKARTQSLSQAIDNNCLQCHSVFR